jgi:hypothetical protein
MKSISFVAILSLLLQAMPVAQAAPLSGKDKEAADKAASGEGSKGAGQCGGLTVGGKNLDVAHPKRNKKLERWCGKDGKSGGSLRQELAQLKQKFTTNSCSDLTNGGKGMTGAKASNLDVKGMIAKAEKRLDETCGSYAKYLDTSGVLCKRYGEAAAEIKAQGASGAEGSNQAALCEASGRSSKANNKLAHLTKLATHMGTEARRVKGLKSYDDAEMKNNLGELKDFSELTMRALLRQANLKKAAREQDAATSSGGDAIGFARSSDVKSFYKRVEACQEALKTVKPFLTNYKELASDLNYFPLEADQLVNDFGEQQNAHGEQAVELAKRANKLNSGEKQFTCNANPYMVNQAPAPQLVDGGKGGVSEPNAKDGTASVAEKRTTGGEVAKDDGSAATSRGIVSGGASEEAKAEEPRTATEKAEAQQVAGGKGDRKAPGSLEESAREYEAKNGKAASSGNQGAGANAVDALLYPEDKNVTTVEKSKPGMTNKDINDAWNAGPTSADSRSHALEDSSAKTYGDVQNGSLRSTEGLSEYTTQSTNSGSARSPASVAATPAPTVTPESFPVFDQPAYRAGRENLRSQPIQAGESYNEYAQRVVGARPVGSPITISNGTTWQPYTGGKLENRRMLLPVQR